MITTPLFFAYQSGPRGAEPVLFHSEMPKKGQGLGDCVIVGQPVLLAPDVRVERFGRTIPLDTLAKAYPPPKGDA